MEVNKANLYGTQIKGELNVDKKWQLDDLCYIIMNEIRPCVHQF